MIVLLYKYDDNSLTNPVRVYPIECREQAERDLDLLVKYSSNDRTWYLQEVELYNIKTN